MSEKNVIIDGIMVSLTDAFFDEIMKNLLKYIILIQKLVDIHDNTMHLC